MLGAAERPLLLLLLWEELGLALPGCCIMGLTAAMLAAPYLGTQRGPVRGRSERDAMNEAWGGHPD